MHRLLHEAAELYELRTAVRRELAGLGGDAWLWAVVLAVEEAAGNALLHGLQPGSPVDVRLAVHAREIRVEVSGGTPGLRLPPPGPCPAGPYDTNGRGLYLISRLMDSLEVDAQPGCTRLRMIKRLRAA